MADTIGILIEGAYIRPDKSFSRSFKPRIHLAKFGDGYEQRLVNGINSIDQVFSVSFENRERDEIDRLITYFSSLQGVTAFDFRIPDTNGDANDETAIKVVCDDFNTTYDSLQNHSCSAKFRRVYEA